MPETAPRRRLRLGPLWLQVLVAVVLGAGFGIAFPRAAATAKPLGDGFVRLIRMVLAPIVFGTVSVGIARMGDLHRAGRVSVKALLYFEAVSSLALLLGMGMVDLLRPGGAMRVDPATLRAGPAVAGAVVAHGAGGVAFVVDNIPTSMVGAFGGGSILPVLLLGVLVGIALAQGGAGARPLVALLEATVDCLFRIVRMIMALAPIGTFGAIAFTTGTYGGRSLLPLLAFTAEVWLASALFVAVVLGAICRCAGFSLLRLLRHLRAEIAVTAGTSSSEAVLAPLMDKLARLGCDRAVVDLVVPAGYTFNADGTSIYLAMSALFIAQATGVALSPASQLELLLVLVLTSKGSAGVSGAGFVTLAATLSAMHRIPVAGIVLLLGVDRLTNAARAVTNVIGNGVATLVVARSEGVLDHVALDAGLAGRAAPDGGD